ncbi:hypothetical protein C8R46DRAFT_1209530 [Mycena filopes]|nr:hypothetical protein C8R46DRAFT_1209530 [Mycena filopes]
MSHIDFSTRESVVYGRQHRQSVPTDSERVKPNRTVTPDFAAADVPSEGPRPRSPAQLGSGGLRFFFDTVIQRYEMERDPDANDDEAAEGSDEEGYTVTVAGDQRVSSLPHVDEQRTMIRRAVKHSSPAVSSPSRTIAYHTPTAPTVPYATNPRHLVRRSHVLNLAPSSSPTPTAPTKRPFAEVDGGQDQRDENSGDIDDDDDSQGYGLGPLCCGPRPSPPPPLRSRRWPLASYADGIQLDKLAVNAWYKALKSLRQTPGYERGSPPTTAELILLKKCFHQVKGASRLSRTTSGGQHAAHNRQLVTDLLHKDSFLFGDCSCPGGLLAHSSLQESNSEAVLIPEYFANGLPEVFLAFVANTVHCIIMERQTGERVKSRMSAKTWQPLYEKHRVEIF